MAKIFVTFIALLLLANAAGAQTREELERQKKQLKAELEETQKMLQENQNKTKVGLSDLALVNRKLDFQGNILNTITKDIDLISNSIYKNQREINKLNLVLDTLRQEYAKSMVYAYKNRSNYNFLNFIFSAESFNEAIKRVAYLKSYRTYRELQGQNIVLTQELLQKRIDELSGNKDKKAAALEGQTKELTELQKQQEQKNQIVAKLKSQGKEFANRIAATKKQYLRVQGAIAAAIKKAQEEARKAALLEAKKREKERLDRLEKERLERLKNKSNPTVITPKEPKKEKIKPERQAQPESVLLDDANRVLNTSFKNNRGSLPWPIEKGYVMMHHGKNELPDGGVLVNPGVTFGTGIGSSIKAIFAGVVSNITNIDNMQVVIIQHGSYFSSYSNLGSVSVQRGQNVNTGQVIGKAAANDEGVGSIDLLISSERGEENPERWIHQ
jgi:murein hydrolase activator